MKKRYIMTIDSWKSMVGYIFILSLGLLSHQSKLQDTITLLLYKIEYITITKVEKKALQVAQFLAYLKFYLSSLPADLCINNKKIISGKKNPEFFRKTKYIKVQLYWV